MKTASVEQIQRLDRRTIHEFGISGLELMERAGKAAIREIEKFCRDLRKRSVAVFAGKGNNGGDGFVIARLLSGRKINVTVYLLVPPSELRGDARTNYLRLKGVVVRLITGTADLEFAGKEVSKAGLIIDAISGTGFKGKFAGINAEAVKLINNSGRKVVSVDVPSGINCDTGVVDGPAVRADMTVTFELPKTGLLLYPGAEYAGKVVTTSIGIPETLIKEEKINVELIEERMVAECLPGRSSDCHKGTAGRVLAIAGSAGMTGAGLLACRSALRTGSGLVYWALPESLYVIPAIKIPEVISEPMPETSGALDRKARKEIFRIAEKADVCLIGPGLGQNRETGLLVKDIIAGLRIPAVIDADGLNLIAKDPGVLKKCRSSLILTPHPGEMSRLTRIPMKQIQVRRIEIARSFAQKYRVTLVLKGAHTVIAGKSGEVYINPTGNPGMATAGSGDVLSGIIASLVGQGLKPEPAAFCGVYLHGLSGDILSEKLGDRGMLAGDLIEKIPIAIKRVITKK